MTRIEFIKKYYPLVKQLGEKTNIFPETVFAQAIIESSGKNGFGENQNVKKGNNYFGIRPGSGWNGATLENTDVKSESKIFRAYDSVEDSIKDYFKFLVNNKRYRQAGVFSAANFEEQARAIADAGYAGKGNEEKYFSLLSKVGSTVQDIFSKFTNVVKQNKTLSAGAIVAGIAFAYYAFNGGKK